jgi:hypothetical protein
VSQQVLLLLVLTKLKSFAFNPAGGQQGNLGQIVLGLSNNSIEVGPGAIASATRFALRSDVDCRRKARILLHY